MSFKAMAWAAEQSPPTATAKLTLMMMASMADGEIGTCFPSHQHLADACMVSKSTIIRSIKDLESGGFLSVKRRATKRGKSSNVYKLTMCQSDTTPVQPNDDAMCQSDTSVNLTLPWCQSDTTPSVNLTHRNSNSFKQSLKQSKKDAELPDFINQENWDDFVQFRKEKKKALKPTTTKMIFRKLSKWQDEGYDVNEILNTSIQNDWTGIFKPDNPTNQKEAEQDKLDRQFEKQQATQS